MYTGGLVCHVLNRSVGRATIFHDAADYAAFENLLLNASELASVQLLTFWHPGHRGGLSAWPVATPSNWIDHVNEPQTEAEVVALRRSLQRGIPFGGEAWQQATASQFGIDLAPRPRGRPRRSRSDCDPPGTR